MLLMLYVGVCCVACLVMDCEQNGDVPIHKAASRGHEAAVSELIRLGSTVDAKNNANFTPDLLAARSRTPSISEILRVLYCK